MPRRRVLLSLAEQQALEAEEIPSQVARWLLRDVTLPEIMYEVCENRCKPFPSREQWQVAVRHIRQRWHSMFERGDRALTYEVPTRMVGLGD